jgi:hypothetical protein
VADSKTQTSTQVAVDQGLSQVIPI